MAGLLGALIGAEREYRHKSAGLRTNTLIALGSAIFTMLSIDLVRGTGEAPSRVAAQIVTGVGFLGAGAILRRERVVHGLTTAATIWVNAAVGMAAGAGELQLAAVGTIVTLLVLTLLIPIERRLDEYHRRRGDAVPDDEGETKTRPRGAGPSD